MSQPMTYDLPAFRNGSDGLGQKGREAGSDLSTGVQSALSPPGASSPVGNQIAMYTGQLQTGLSPAGPALSNGATDLNNTTQQGMSGIENQDAQNAAGFKDGNTTPGDGLAGSDTPGQLDPDSIDQEAQDKAKDMLGGDKSQQMMEQVLQMGMQTASQIAQQLSQQLSQIGSKLGEVVGKAGEQVGQLASKAMESATKSATEAATPDLALDGLGGGGGGFSGGGGGGGGGMDPGTTMPAGLETPVTPMNGSSALQASPLQGAGAGSPAAAASSRMPMMPMMPMHGVHGNNKGQGETTKRDPAIFPEDKLYDGPPGVEQTFGAIPEIESEEPPFGTSGETHTSGR